MFDSILKFIVNCILLITDYFVIFYKLLLLIMQIIFYCYYFPYLKPFLSFIPKEYLSFDFYFNMKKTSTVFDEYKPLIEKIPNSEVDKDSTSELGIIDQYDFSNLIDYYFEDSEMWFWIFLPIIVYIFFIYFLHGMFGLYSAYVDYFQKNPDHVQSIRAYLPAFFFFLFLILIVFVFISYFFILYLIYILWFVFI